MRAAVKKVHRRASRGDKPGLRLWVSLALSASLLLSGCFREEKGERFYGKVVVPSAQEFRWSDGGLPKIFDPARAAAPPDTDAVRALYEGLTDYEPGTLSPAPAVASKWEPADGGRLWTFHLREGARWTNGDPVTAQDFVRSWQRTLRLGERAPHAALLSNIEGAESLTTQTDENEQGGTSSGGLAVTPERAREGESVGRAAGAKQPPRPKAFGVIALDARTLRVTLRRPDMNFPALVAHPVFRPVHELSPGDVLPEWEEQRPDGGALSEPGIVTNGAFSLSRLAGDSVELARAESYWDAASVQLERVRFIDSGDTESALASYRAGEVDVVSNAAVEPLAVKLLTPFEDFRRETFAALNYYRFNIARPPFDDVRVRQALAFALDVERLSKDTLGGAAEPTRTFIPVPEKESGEGTDVTKDEDKDANEGDAAGLEHNVERARRLLEQAGYPGGVNFPRVRLLVNRNEQQRLVAQAVARMWRDGLGVETEIVVRPWEEYEAMLRSGDYDVARRSLVMQTTDEETNMRQLFGEVGDADVTDPEVETTKAATPAGPTAGAEVPSDAALAQARPTPTALSEAQALRELPAIPLHFASSYALVKPYVNGFESNLLDAPSLKHVRINRDWRPPAAEQSARLAHTAKR
jgi:oligopeptide transport system substrate-binding protein